MRRGAVRGLHFAREADGRWILTVYTSPDAILQLVTVDAQLNLVDIYRKVTFEDAHELR